MFNRVFVFTLKTGWGLRTRDWKTRDGQKCRVGKRGTKLQDWKTREYGESQMYGGP